MKNLILLLAGAFGGVAFVLACGSGGSDRVSAGGNANAQPSSGCSAWQVANVDLGEVVRAPDLVLTGAATTAVYELPAGWEPYAPGTSWVHVRRCKP